ncbi:pseudouridine synthase [Nocardia carnea]|uniref:pseudouridine synthase n=1 Tax=Nocardia carnea TaxID=37328 RepID=UPI00245888EA|nr:pseudouridine synthase [Nocardia carnea]
MNTPARRDGTPDRRQRSDQPSRAGRGRGAGEARRGGEPPRYGRGAEPPRGGRAGGTRSAERGARSEQVQRPGRGAGGPEAPAGRRGSRPVAGRGGFDAAGRGGDESSGRGGPASAGRGGSPAVGRTGGAAAGRGGRLGSPGAGRGGSAPGSRSGGRPAGGASARKSQTTRSGSGTPQLNNAKPARHQHVEPEGPGHEKMPWGEGERLQKVLAKAGVASRRAAEEMIDQGRVEVDGIIVREQGLRIDPENAVVRVDGIRVVVREELVHLALNKPKGWQSTMSDDLGRPCVGDIVAERVAAGQRLFHVGRLDADTEGLLLLTNDGDLAHRLMHPSYQVSKTYLATVQGEVHRSIGKILRDGVELEDGPATVDKFQVLEVDAGRSLVKVVLHEGRKHIVRRLLDAVGHPVVRLVRTHIGPVVLADQRPGTLRVLGRDEIGKLYEAVSL